MYGRIRFVCTMRVGSEFVQNLVLRGLNEYLQVQLKRTATAAEFNAGLFPRSFKQMNNKYRFPQFHRGLLQYLQE